MTITAAEFVFDRFQWPGVECMGRAMSVLSSERESKDPPLLPAVVLVLGLSLTAAWVGVLGFALVYLIGGVI